MESVEIRYSLGPMTSLWRHISSSSKIRTSRQKNIAYSQH